MKSNEFITETFSDSRLRNLPGGRRSGKISGGLTPHKKGDVRSMTEKGIKVHGVPGLLGVGDWLYIRANGQGKKIKSLHKGKVRLEDGRFYSYDDLYYDMD